jgi:hypothetical protein
LAAILGPHRLCSVSSTPITNGPSGTNVRTSNLSSTQNSPPAPTKRHGPKDAMVALEVLDLPKTHGAQRGTNGSFARSSRIAPASSSWTWGHYTRPENSGTNGFSRCSILVGRVGIITSLWRTGDDRTLPLLLRACLVRVRVKPFWRSLAYAEDLSVIALFSRNAPKTEEAAP